jgi:hypothetical protein
MEKSGCVLWASASYRPGNTVYSPYWLIWVKFSAESLYIMPQCDCDCCENQQNDINLYWTTYMKFTCIFYIFAQIWYRTWSQFLKQLQDLWIWCSESHASLMPISVFSTSCDWSEWNQHTILLNIWEFHENLSRQDCTYRHKLNYAYMCNI